MILFERPNVNITEGGGGGTWGTIDGTLADQADLQDALDAKASTDQLTSEVSDLQAVDEATQAQLGGITFGLDGAFLTISHISRSAKIRVIDVP